jgi:radical SAM superfamily enzyme YgiQ (UPF0313 family)
MSHSSQEKNYTYGYGPVKLLAVASHILPNSMFNYSFFDMKNGFGNIEQDLEIIVRSRPDILGFTVYLWSFQRIEQLLARVREALPKSIVILGGPSAGDFDKISTMPSLPDFIVVGEGEKSFLSLLEGIYNDDPFYLANLAVPVGERIKGCFKPTVLQETIGDLNWLTSPYLANLYSPPGELLYLETSRGCPNTCAYCVCGDSARKLRYFDIQMVKNEIIWAAQNNKRDIDICDSAINYHSERLIKITDAIHDVSSDDSLNFTFALHSDFIDSKQIKNLARIKVRCATMGLNSVNPSTFVPVGRIINRNMFSKKAIMLKELGNVNITIMMGLPGDTVDGFKATLDYCAALDIQINCFQLRIFSGTRFFREADKYGLKYDVYDGMKIKSCFSYNEDDLDRMREMFFSYRNQGAKFVWGDID